MRLLMIRLQLVMFAVMMVVLHLNNRGRTAEQSLLFMHGCGKLKKKKKDLPFDLCF